MVDRDVLTEWLAGYERAWRAVGTAMLADLFTDDVVYLPSPWAAPIVGLAELGRFWKASREGPDEGFRMMSELVVEQGGTAVVRVEVDYDDGERWRDLWVVTLDDRGRCSRFEEWPFAPDQRDGHEHDRQ